MDSKDLPNKENLSDIAKEIAKAIDMAPHPEGGFFKEKCRNDLYSVCYYMICNREKSIWRKLDKDEICTFNKGFPITIEVCWDGERVEQFTLGPDLNKDHLPCCIIPKDQWARFGTSDDYSFLTLTVCPPFQWEKLELSDKSFDPMNKKE